MGGGGGAELRLEAILYVRLGVLCGALFGRSVGGLGVGVGVRGGTRVAGGLSTQRRRDRQLLRECPRNASSRDEEEKKSAYACVIVKAEDSGGGGLGQKAEPIEFC